MIPDYPFENRALSRQEMPFKVREVPPGLGIWWNRNMWRAKWSGITTSGSPAPGDKRVPVLAGGWERNCAIEIWILMVRMCK
jgi:hypothetical protein